jgi:guanine nucleotide-binding protein alpha-1 subunit
MSSIEGEDDPFHEFMRPPPNETPAQMTARLTREEQESRANEAIEEDIKRQKALSRKERNIVRVLLLGQAESGVCIFPSHAFHVE